VSELLPSFGAGDFSPASIVAVVAAALGLGVAIVVGAVALSGRRRLAREAREVVRALEELRMGRVKERPEMAAGSPLAVVADAVQRLGSDLVGRRAEADAAAERWRSVSDAIRDTAILTTDTDGDVRSFSLGAAQLTGWQEDEVVGRPAALLFEEQAYRDLLPQLARRDLRARGVTARSVLLRRDGSRCPVEVSVRLLAGAAGTTLGFMLVVRDIAEPLRVEAELRESERRYRGLVEGLSDGVIIVQQGRLAYVNPAAQTLCGAPAEQLVGGAWRERVATRDVLVVEELLAAIERGVRAQGEGRCTLLGPDRQPRAEVRVRATPVEYAGAPAALLLLHDETAERRTERELRHNEVRLDAVLEATQEGVLVLAEAAGERRVRMTNRALAALLGLPVDELLGAAEPRLIELLARRGGVAAHLARRLAEPADAGRAERVVGESGEPVVELRVVALAGRSGERLGRLVVCRDLTERARSERELQAQAEQLQLGQLELEQAYRDLAEVNARAEQRGRDVERVNRELRRLDEMRAELLGNVSHELQTPLVSIRGYTEMILKERLGPLTDEQRKGLRLALKNIDRLISMIDHLLAFSRLDPALRDLNLSSFELEPLVAEAADVLRGPIAEKELDVRLALPPGIAPVEADRDKILQVFLNLLSNAIKFSHRGGLVEISAAPGRPGYVAVRVRDTGVGIPEEAVGRIFDRHFQVTRPGEEKPEGSGLGLAIVRDILRVHGCAIEARSEEGRGTELSFTLPLARERGLEEPAAAEPGPAAPAPEPEVPATPEASGPPAAGARARLRIIRRGDPGPS